MRSSALLLVALLSGCAGGVTMPPPREPVRIDDAVRVPAPPAATLVTNADGEAMACYPIDDAWLLADTIDAGVAAGEQAEHLVAAARALDAEATERDRAWRGCRAEVEAARREHRSQLWVWRGIAALLGAILIGVAQ